MKRTNYIIALAILITTSCQHEPNRLIGHKYRIEPINEIIKSKLNMLNATITHEYEHDHTVKVVTYFNGQALKTEEMQYSLTGNIYRMDDEIYTYRFKNDTVVFYNENEPFLELVPIK